MTVTGAHPPRTHRRVARSKRDLLTALSAAATLLGLVVGLPIVLVAATGWPWPAHMPTADQVGRGLLQPDDGHLLAKVLVGIAWIAWLLFASGVVVETLGQVRGTLPRRLPVISPMQQLVAPLVAAIALVVHAPAASLAFAASSANNAQVVPTRPVAATIPEQMQAAAAPASPPQLVTTDTKALRLYVVHPAHDGSRDTLWSIAANHLGDPLRWHEIADLNRERVQPDGGRLTDPHWIRPGWRLLMPADATDLPVADAPQHHHTPPPVRARPTEPVAPAPRDDGGPEIPEPVVHTPTGHEAGSSRDAAASPPQAKDAEPALPIGLTVMGVLAAGLLAILGRKRAVQRRHRRTGERVRKPPAASVPTEIRLRVAADPPAADAVAEALRALAAAAHEQAEHVQAAELSGHELDLLLDEPTELPAPFVEVADGIRWRFDRSLAEAQDGHSALPAMASVGHRDGRLIFLDLERLHVLSLTGDLAAADQLLSWIAADLAAGAWAVTTNVTLVGVAPPLTALDNERLRLFDHLTQDVIETVESHRGEFDATGYVDALDTRTGDPLEPWPVEVVLMSSAASSDPELLDRLVHVAKGDRRNGVAVVIAGDVHSGGTRAVIEGGLIRIPQLAIEGVVARLTEDEVRDIGQLCEAACELDSEPAQPTNAAALPYPEDCHQETPAPPVSACEPRLSDDDLDAQVGAYLIADPAALRVQLLGPVMVSAPGALEQKRLPTSTELVVYLACSPYGATLTDVDEVLWPERLIPKHTRNNVIYRARTWAGRTSDDEPRLTRVDSGGRLYLRDALVDWQLFERLIARAGKRHGSERTTDLRTALSLVRGKPFESIPPGRYAWLAGRNFEEHMAAVVVDTAHALAAELLATGEAQAARDVARTAQLVDRHDERPWRDLLRAEAALGRPRKVREHVRSLMRTLEVEVPDELMPETAELISQLLANEPTLATG